MRNPRLLSTYRGRTLKNTTVLLTAAAIGCASLVGSANTAFAQEKTVKIGIVTFLSGGAAGPFGVPARNAAELVIEAINSGSVPAPYQIAGIGGATIEPIFVDENSKQKNADFQKLVQKNGVEMVVGYISSASCLAIAPEAEKLKKLTILFDCGTPQVFEETVTDPKYTFRTGGLATMDSVGAVRYLQKMGMNVSSYAGMNQNYAWGQDSWRDFTGSMAQVYNSARVISEQFPKVAAGQYDSEVSALLTGKPDLIHSSFWGGDMEAFVIQGSARGVFQRSKMLLTAGETAMHRLAAQMPDGTIVGARGTHGELAPQSALNDWFRKAYFDRFGALPTYPSYKMAQALLGVKAAADKAGSSDQDELIGAMKGLEWEGPSGKISMALANGHQAVQDIAYGTYKYDKENGKATLVDVVRFKASCVNPPAGVKSGDWIAGGFKGADCN